MLEKSSTTIIALVLGASTPSSKGGMRLPEGASQVWRGRLAFAWGVVAQQCFLTGTLTSLGVQIGKLDESLSGFWSRHRKMSKWKKEVKTFPSSKPIPRTPLPTYSSEVWKPVDFSRKCQFPPASLQLP